MIEIQKDNAKLFVKLYNISQNSIAPRSRLNKSVKKEAKGWKRRNNIDNTLILKKLTTVKSVLKLKNFEKDFRNHLEYVQLGQRLRLPKIKN